MTRTLTLFLLAAGVACAQAPEKADLLKRTEELEGLIAAGEWGKAAELSRSLKESVTAARNQSLAANGSQLADSILNWMPPDTETFVMAQQPFTILKEDQRKIPTALGAAQSYVLGLLGAAEKEELYNALLGRTVRLAAVGARRFGEQATDENRRAALGMIAYQGCGVYAFAEPVAVSILPRPPEDSVMGHRVWISKGTQNDQPDEDTYLVSLLEPDLILVCNNREFFQEMVSRRGLPQASRALPANLAEWKQLDRTAPLWAISHFHARGMLGPLVAMEAAGKDPRATGITLEFGLASGVTRARMIAKSDPWKRLAGNGDFHGFATSSKVADNVWELSISGNPEAADMAAFALMGMVGFVILL